MCSELSALLKFYLKGELLLFHFQNKKLMILREQIAHWMEMTLDEATDPWGVKVERVEM